MRKLLCIPFLLVLLTAAGPAQAARPAMPSSWALGFTLGDPTGLSAKHWLGGPDAIDFGLGFGPGVRVQADYLFGLARLARERSLYLDLYLGAGGVIGTGDGYCVWRRGHHFCGDDGGFFGVRVPFGIDFILRQAPLELGLEIAPGVWAGHGHIHGMLDGLLFLRFLL